MSPPPVGATAPANLPGVLFLYGDLEVDSQDPGGTMCEVAVNGPNLALTLDGAQASFPLGQAAAFSYLGSKGGGDTVVDATNLTSLIVFPEESPGNNNVTVGSYYTFVTFYGTGNTLTVPNKNSYVIVQWHGGMGSGTINNPNGATIKNIP